MNQNVIKLFLLFHFLHILYCKKPFENYLYICKTTLYFLNELFDNFERSNLDACRRSIGQMTPVKSSDPTVRFTKTSKET